MTSQLYYTSERNVQIVISLLKAHGIKRVIVSPGTTNMSFVGSVQQDSFFEIFSCVDERSAAYMACGIAYQTSEPVVLSCTGATASRNYMPGLTEAYYRKLPVLAITSHRGDHAIGHLLDQQIDRRVSPSDIYVEKVSIPLVKDRTDEQYCTIEANRAILALTHRGGGPVHMNLHTNYSRNFNVKVLPQVRAIYRYSYCQQLPVLDKGKKIAVFVGAHKSFTKEETRSIDSFCSSHNAVVFCDHTSGYNGKYRVNFALIGSQKYHVSENAYMDILIHIGEVSGNAFGASLHPKEVWRVSEDGEIRDTFNKLVYIFEMSEYYFFDYYSETTSLDDTYLEECRKEYNRLLEKIPPLPFSNIWICQQLHDMIPQGAILHLGILNSLRSMNFFDLDRGVTSISNVGGFGIDGGLSSLVGASIVSPNKLCFGIFGDLAFFYDMNVLGNRHLGNNLRILLINNGRGTEFRHTIHPCAIFGEAADPFMAAAGHFGQQSRNLVKHLASDLGFEYLSAESISEFSSSIHIFLDQEEREKPVLLEAFTDTKNESMALDLIMSIIVDNDEKIKHSVKKVLKKAGGETLVDVIRKIVK